MIRKDSRVNSSTYKEDELCSKNQEQQAKHPAGQSLLVEFFEYHLSLKVSMPSQDTHGMRHDRRDASADSNIRSRVEKGIAMAYQPSREEG